MQNSALSQKIKITVNKQLWEVLSGHVTASRRSKLPLLTVGTSSASTFNRAAAKIIPSIIDKKCLNIYRLQNGMLLLEFCDIGMLKITKSTTRKYTEYHFGNTILKKYLFAAGNKKDIYYFYLHETDKPNLFVLKELQNSWE